MPDYRGQEPRDGDYASLISKLDSESLKGLMKGTGASAQSGHAIQAMLDASSAASEMASREASSRMAPRNGAFKSQAPFNTSMANGAAGPRSAGKRRSSGMNGFAYLGISLGLLVMLVISGDPDFGIFCVLAFGIVTFAFASSRYSASKKNAQKNKGPRLP